MGGSLNNLGRIHIVSIEKRFCISLRNLVNDFMDHTTCYMLEANVC